MQLFSDLECAQIRNKQIMDEAVIKRKLLDTCKQYVEDRIMAATLAMNQAQESANEEGRSSAGDKYETGRAMMQIEREKAAEQVEEALKLRYVLDRIDADAPHDVVSLGSLVITSTLNIFLAIGAGRVTVDGEDFVIVAPVSPLGKAMLGLKMNEQFTFNNYGNTITKIL